MAWIRLVCAPLILFATASASCSEAEAPSRPNLLAPPPPGLSVEQRRPLDIAVAKATAEAQKRCGGRPVVMNVEDDPADHGSDPADYQCADD